MSSVPSTAAMTAVHVPVHMPMTAAAVAAASMSFAMPVAVMVAMHRRVIGQFPSQEIVHGSIGLSLHAAIEGDARMSQGVLGAADAPANQGVNLFFLQEGGQCAMACAVAVKDMGFLDLVVLYGVDFELLGVAEMLENLAVFVGDCKLHDGWASFLHRKSART